MKKKKKNLTLTLDIATYLEDLDDNELDDAIQEYADFMAGEEIPFTQEGSEFTFKGTEDELVEVLYKDQMHWGAGFSFSEEDAREEILSQNS